MCCTDAAYQTHSIKLNQHVTLGEPVDANVIPKILHKLDAFLKVKNGKNNIL